MRTVYAALLGAVLAAVSGCAALAGERDAAAAAAEGFHAAAARGDGAAACAALAPETRRNLERDEGKPCAAAVVGLRLRDGHVRGVDVYGDEAWVRLDRDTVFATHLRQGWRVTAAGCTPRPKRPYDCEVEK